MKHRLKTSQTRNRAHIGLHMFVHAGLM